MSRKDQEPPLRRQLAVIPAAIAGMLLFLWLEQLSRLEALDLVLRACAWACAIVGSATTFAVVARALRRG